MSETIVNQLSYILSDDGYNYIDTFNPEWQLTQENDLSGPSYCENCRCYGSILQNGIEIFLGYCLNCAKYIYDGSRGPGFSGFINKEIVNAYEYPDYLSMYKNLIVQLSATGILEEMSDLEKQLSSPLEMYGVRKDEDEDVVLFGSCSNTSNCLTYCGGGDCDCGDTFSDDFDFEFELSQKDSDVYTDSDDEYI